MAKYVRMVMRIDSLTNDQVLNDDQSYDNKSFVITANTKF
jgi:hypothetical protein